MSWTDVCASSELEVESARLLETDRHRVAVFRTAAGEVFAVDNACPHEGYPLVQGEVKDGVLTCVWHNFKFDLASGACLKGDEDVRSHPVRERDGRVEVDLTAEDPSRVIAQARRSLEEGMREAQIGRMARDVARLLQAGVPAAEILADAAALDARYAEYGTTHATPVACDLLEYLDGDVEHDTLVILQALELVSDANVRRPAQDWASPVFADDFGDALVLAIESEDVDRAIGLVRGGLRQHSREEVGRALLRCASEHFLGFGHPLICVTKALELLDRDDRHTEDVFCALALRTLSSTREDTLPPMARWRELVDARRDEFTLSERRLSDDEIARMSERILDPKDREIEGEFVGHLVGDTAAPSLVDVLVEAAAERFLRFDASIHDDWTVQDGWLSVTHPLTFAHAIREALERCDEPAILPSLVWALAFIRRSHRLDGKRPGPGGAEPVDDAAAVVAALDQGERAAVDAAARWNGEDAELAELLRNWLLDGRATRPIHVAHQIKTLRVALQERRRNTPLMATMRYLSHPVAERDLRSTAHDAAQLVLFGNLPKRRAS